MSSRPRRLVVGEEALVRRCWGRRRAAALVVAEHALLPLGLCLVSWLRRTGAGGSPSCEDLGSAWTSDATARTCPASGACGGRERCALGAQVLPMMPRLGRLRDRGRDHLATDDAFLVHGTFCRRSRAGSRSRRLDAKAYGFLVAASKRRAVNWHRADRRLHRSARGTERTRRRRRGDARHAAPWHARAASGPSLPKSLSAHALQRARFAVRRTPRGSP